MFDYGQMVRLAIKYLYFLYVRNSFLFEKKYSDMVPFKFYINLIMSFKEEQTFSCYRMNLHFFTQSHIIVQNRLKKISINIILVSSSHILVYAYAWDKTKLRYEVSKQFKHLIIWTEKILCIYGRTFTLTVMYEM